MFTIDQIRAAHARVKSGADFPTYVQEMQALGVTHYDIAVEDGRATYYGTDNFSLSGKATYPDKRVAQVGSGAKLKQALAVHQQGQTDYLTFCEQAAEAGVDKWTTHMLNREVTYFDKQGKLLLREAIPQND